MNNFTPQELLYVAKVTIPDEDWQIFPSKMAVCKDGYVGCYSYPHMPEMKQTTPYIPEENAEQWRALAEYCIDNEICVKRIGCSDTTIIYAAFDMWKDYALTSSFHNPVLSMIAAVLALREATND